MAGFMTDVALDDCMISSLTELLGRVEQEKPAEFRECQAHSKTRDIAYMVEVGDNVWECTEEHCCKIPRAALKPRHGAKPRFCHICKVVLNSEKQATLHFESAKHVAKVKEHNVENMKNRVARNVRSPNGSGEETEEKEQSSEEGGLSSSSSVSNSSGSLDASQFAGITSPLRVLPNAIPAGPADGGRFVMQHPMAAAAQPQFYYTIQPQRVQYVHAFPPQARTVLAASGPPQPHHQQPQQQQPQQQQQQQVQHLFNGQPQFFQFVLPQNAAQQQQQQVPASGTRVILMSSWTGRGGGDEGGTNQGMLPGSK